MGIDLNKLRNLHLELTEKQAGGKNNDFYEKFYKIEEGKKNTIRLLPGREEDEFYARTAIHRISTGVDSKGNELTKNYHCRRVHNETCPLCDLYFSLWKEPYGRDNHKALARKIKARDRYYFNVLDRSVEDATSEGAIKILSVGMKLFDKIIGTMCDEDFGDITDFKTGNDFKLVKTQVDGWPNYDQSSPRPKSTETGNKQEIAAIKENMHNIQELVKLFEYDDVKACADLLEASLTATQEEKEEGETLGNDDEKYIDEVQG